MGGVRFRGRYMVRISFLGQECCSKIQYVNPGMRLTWQNQDVHNTTVHWQGDKVTLFNLFSLPMGPIYAAY